MRILRAVYNRAVANGVVAQQYPFRPTYTGIDKTRKRAVDFSVIKTIKEADLSAHPSLELARDLFLMSFYLRGPPSSISPTSARATSAKASSATPEARRDRR